MGLARRKSALGTRRARRGLASFRSPLTAFVVALSLIVQLFAALRRLRSPRPPSLAPMTRRSPPSSRRSSATRRELCAHINDDSAPGKHAPCGHCCDQCPLCRFAAAGRGVCPARPAGVAGAARAATRMRSARRPAATFFPPIPPSPIPPGRLPSQSDGCSPRAPSGARSHSFRLEDFLPCRPPKSARPRARSRRSRGPVAHARLSSRCLRRPYLPGHARHRRSRRSRRAHAADRQLCSLQLRRRPRVGRELQLDQDDHPGPQRGDRRRADLGAPGRLRLERARHRAAVAGAVHPRRRVHVQGRLRHIAGPEPARESWRAPAGKTLTLRWWSRVSASERCRPLSNTCARSPSPANSARPPRARTGRTAVPNVSTFNWGFTLQYSLPYFNTQLAEIDNDFLKHLVPIAEFAFQTPIHNGAAAGVTTTGYFQPGVIYEADKWQIALEAMVPMTGATGHGVGVIGSLDFYLDDIPNRIDEPIFPHGLGIAPGI